MTRKTVVITGGNRGIGYDISKTFMQAGYDVFVGARKDCALEKTLGDKVLLLIYLLLLLGHHSLKLLLIPLLKRGLKILLRILLENGQRKALELMLFVPDFFQQNGIKKILLPKKERKQF